MRVLSYALAIGIGFASLTAPAAAFDITGAGATFPFPVYTKWAEAYRNEAGVGLNYQSIGSGGGIKQIESRTVDFGATDAPLSAKELEKAGLVQFPSVMGGVVAVVNVEGLEGGKLRLTGEVLADIFMGKIEKWNDLRIAELNAGVGLPDATIVPVYRSDSSGTTSIFTTYLSEVSEDWKAAYGSNKTISWPVGQGGKGNEGVAATVRQVPNSIGYVEYAYAKQGGLPVVLVRNAAGNYPQPDLASFQAAGASADWRAAAGLGISLTNQPGNDAWPITAATFILVPAKPEDPERTAEVLKFFDWAYENGDALAAELDYVPLPDAVVGEIRTEWKSVVDTAGKSIYGM
jgi:phosphate transport system substrate-binding protein